MKKIEKGLDIFMRFLMAVAMLALVAGGTWQIFTRWVMNDPSTVTDEFLRYVLIWASFLGSAYCFYRDEHLSLTLFTDKAKGPVKVIMSVFIEACILFFVVYVFIYGGIAQVKNASNVSPVMHIPYKFLFSIEPICGVLILLARVLKYIQLISAKGEKTA